MPGRPLCVLALALSLCPGVLPAQLPAPTARLEGVVVDPLQRPVVGAEVIVEWNGEVRGRTFSDGEGTFVFGRLPQDVVTVRATTKAPDIGGVWVDLLGLERGFARIVTMPARKVTGTVRDRKGATVAGAWIVSAPCDGDGALATCQSRSDAEGRFELHHVPFGRSRLRAWAPGHDAGQAFVDGIEAVHADVVMDEDGIEVQTFQLAGADRDQRAAATLLVTAWDNGVPLPLPPPLRRVSFDTDGNAKVLGWPRSDYLTARVLLPGTVVTPPYCDTVAGMNDSKCSFAVGATGARVRGRLTGAEVSLGGRRVLVQSLRDASALRRVVATTAADGSFDLPSPVEPGSDFALRACDPDVTVDGKPPDVCWYVGTHDSVEHAVAVTRSTRVDIRVRTASGVWTAGATVLVFPATATARARRQLDEQLYATPGLLGRGTTGFDGRACIGGLNLQPDTRIACIVIAEIGWCEGVAIVGDSLVADCGEVSLAPGASVELTTHDADGLVLPGVRIRCVPQDQTLVAWHARTSDREGRLRIGGLVPGVYTVFSHQTWQHTVHRFAEGPNDINLR